LLAATSIDGSGPPRSSPNGPRWSAACACYNGCPTHIAQSRIRTPAAISTIVHSVSCRQFSQTPRCSLIGPTSSGTGTTCSPKPPRLVTLRVDDVARFVDGSVCARGVTDMGIVKILVTSWWMIDFMPAVGDLVRCTDGSWMTRPPQSCPRGHRFTGGRLLDGLAGWPRRQHSAVPQGQGRLLAVGPTLGGK
jgi:hypothetical protein